MREPQPHASGPPVRSSLPPDKRGWPRLAVSAMVRRAVRRHFHAVRVQGLDRLRAALEADPSGLVLAANHSCWWDLYLAHILNEAVPLDGYGMMEHANLRRFGFFRRIGAYSVERSDPTSVRQAIATTAELLGRPRAGVWIFPQGRIAAHDARPLAFQRGLRVLLSRAGSLRVVPVALRYEYWQEQRPEALVRFGSETRFDRGDRTTVVERAEADLTATLEALRADALRQNPDDFTPILRGPRSVNERVARLQDRFRAHPRGPADDA